MIIDIIVILKCYLIIYSIDNEGVRIRYPCPNTDTLCYIQLDNIHIIVELIR